MKQPRHHAPGLSERDGTVFYKGDPVAVLGDDVAYAHARWDFIDFLEALARAEIHLPADADNLRVETAWQEDRIAALEHEANALQAEIEELREEIAYLERQISRASA